MGQRESQSGVLSIDSFGTDSIEWYELCLRLFVRTHRTVAFSEVIPH